jgi:thiamine biosynthesis lipoprotein
MGRKNWKIGLLGIWLVCSGLGGYAQVHEVADTAFAFAARTGRPVLLVFAGTDWCQPCMRFEREVLADSVFQAYADTRLVILRAAFPQRTRLPKQLQTQNDALAARYNPHGYFPHLVILGPDQAIRVVIPYERQTAEAFIRQVTPWL